MDRKSQLPFTAVLDALLFQEELPLSLLFRLSDMSERDFEQFQQQWAKTTAERRRQVVQHLADLTEENFSVEFSPVFSLGLQDQSADVRLAALEGLWDSEEQHLVPLIIQLMQNDPLVAVRKAATDTLAHFVLLGEWKQLPAHVEEEVVATLINQFQDPATPHLVRCAAIASLGSSSNSNVPHLIRKAYQSDNHELMISAVFAMGNNADERWLPIILDEMESHDPLMRAEAARAAGEIGSEEAMEMLKLLLDDEEGEVIEAAIEALGKMGGDEALYLLRQALEDERMEAYHEQIEDALEETELWNSIDLELSRMRWDDEDEGEAEDDDAF